MMGRGDHPPSPGPTSKPRPKPVPIPNGDLIGALHWGEILHIAPDMSKKDEGNVTFFIKHLNTKDDLADSVSSGHFKKSEVPRIGGSILGLLDEVETKMETMDLFSVKRCSGNLSFDYVHSEVVRNSRGILCVWDPNSFHKENSTISDSFVMVRGVWCPTGQKFMLIAVFHDIKMGGGSVNLSHMFYTDDAVFIGQWCESNITTPVHVLECFHKASGLRINMCKSKVIGVHVDGDMVKNAAKKLRCLVLKTHFSYLGSIVGGSMHRRQYWIDIVDKVKKRLSKWKLQSLSIGGRLTLVKAILGTIPIFNVSIFIVPRDVLRELEGIRRQFSMVMNLTVKRIIKAIHGVDGCVGGNSMVRKPSCWMSIIKEMDVLKMKGIDLMKHMRIKVGNGESTSFWEDKWCDAGVLKDRRLPRRGCEQNQVNELEDLMRLLVLSPNENRWMWGLENLGLFSP
nr:RNA-directed DNA polymerase, eukaryota [Tanacetum cinerariifolium]